MPFSVPVSRLRVVAAAFAASVGMASAGSLPGAAQDVASEMLAKVGITVPGANDSAGTHPDVRGSSTSVPSASADAGKGAEISELATTTDLTGVEKGAAVSTAASGGKSQAGRHGSAFGHERAEQRRHGHGRTPPAAARALGGNRNGEYRERREERGRVGQREQRPGDRRHLERRPQLDRAVALVPARTRRAARGERPSFPPALAGLFDDVDERLLVECAAVEPALDGQSVARRRKSAHSAGLSGSTTLRLSFQMTATRPSPASMSRQSPMKAEQKTGKRLTCWGRASGR